MRRTERHTFFFTKADVFSNWHPSGFELRGIRFNCVEQAMMYAKAIEFGDRETGKKILETPDPKAQKALGRQVKNFNKARWDAVVRNVVYAAAKAKFTQNPHMLRHLLDTEGTLLVEASPYDTIWGVGLAEWDPRIDDPQQWRGTNWLGEVLTRLRDDLLPDLSPNRRRAAPGA